MSFPRKNTGGGSEGDALLAGDNAFTGSNTFNGEIVSAETIQSWNGKLDIKGSDPKLLSDTYMNFIMGSKGLSENRIRGQIDGADNWVVGKATATNDNIYLESYAHGISFVLTANQATINKPIASPLPTTVDHLTNKFYVDNLLESIAFLDDGTATAADIIVAVRNTLMGAEA